MDRVGQSHAPDRDLYLVELKDLEADLPDRAPPDSRMFICFLVGDFTSLARDTITGFGERCIALGAVYFCVWGPGCSRAHDCIDLARDENETDETLIPTSWHEHEALYEALYFAIFNAFPAAAYFSDTTAMIAMVLGNSRWSAELRGWMSNPEELRARVLSEFESGSA